MTALHTMTDRELADRLGSADAEVKALREEFKKRNLTEVTGVYYAVNLKRVQSTRVSYRSIVDLYEIPKRVISKYTQTVNETRFYIRGIK